MCNEPVDQMMTMTTMKNDAMMATNAKEKSDETMTMMWASSGPVSNLSTAGRVASTADHGMRVTSHAMTNGATMARVS